MKKLFILFVLLITALSSPVVQADTLIMKNGDRITGEVVTKEGGTLTFKTEYGEPFAIQWGEVESLSTDEPLKILDERDLSVSDTSHIDQDSPLHPSQPSWNKYTFNPEPWRLGEGAKFTGRINFGYQIDRGNTDKDEFDADLFMEVRELKNRYTFQGTLENDESEGVKTADKYDFSADYDRFLNEKLFVSALFKLEADEFADLDRRLTYGSTLGYQFFEEKKKSLSVEAGPAWVDESFEVGEDDEFWAGLWKVNYEHDLITGKIRFYHRQEGALNLEDTDKVLLDAWFGLRAPIYGGITGAIEYYLDYDSEPSPGNDEADNQFGLKLGFEW